MIKISPSLLSSDLSRLCEEIGSVEEAGADMIHIDVMDGHFVPNLTFGPAIVEAARKCTSLPLDVHLMIENPEKYINAFVDAGADIITVHVEVCSQPHKVADMIRLSGRKAGIALNPGTPVMSAELLFSFVDVVVLMGVNPGFAGQEYIKETTDKIIDLRKHLKRMRLKVDIEVDGGINMRNVKEIVKAGADILAASSAIFGQKDRVKTIRQMREKAKA